MRYGPLVIDCNECKGNPTHRVQRNWRADGKRSWPPLQCCDAHVPGHRLHILPKGHPVRAMAGRGRFYTVTPLKAL